ncbi:MAG: hypothetical protein QM718_15275 [Steroidobacteraceae bacterium]
MTAASLLALAACGSKGSVSIGSGQSSDSATVDFSIAYVKRVTPQTQDEDDLRQQRDISTAANLYVRDQASASGTETKITGNAACDATTGMGAGSEWDIRDLDVSTDGTRLIFAARQIMDQDENETPNWGIWEFVIGSTCPVRVISDDVTADAGQDLSPHYLPDNGIRRRILFSSTRQPQSKSVLLDEGKPQFEAQTEDRNEPAFTLHVMNGDGTDIHQISFNQSHDIYGAVLSVLKTGQAADCPDATGNSAGCTGRIVFTRWDSARDSFGARRNAMHLYSANPDGSDQQLLYGAESHDSGSCGDVSDCDDTIEFVRVREMEDGKLLALGRPFTNADFGGNLYIIDAANYVEQHQGVPTVKSAISSAAGPGQVTATSNDVRNGVANELPLASPGGRFLAAYPLWDDSGRILVSWSECRLQQTDGTVVACTDANMTKFSAGTLTLAPSVYSLWLFNPSDNTFKPIFEPTEGVMVTDVVSLQARGTAQLPAYIADTSSSTLSSAGLAILDIPSVYDWDDGTWSGLASSVASLGGPSGATISGVSALAATYRPARFLRIEKAVSLPSDDPDDGNGRDFDTDLAFGPNGRFMREIIGYVPIEPDGSVRVKVPANVAFQAVVLDANGRRIFQPNNIWQQLRPGEVGSCFGCYYRPMTVTDDGDTISVSHHRNGLFTPVYSGASTYSGTALQPPSGCTQTMAETLFNYVCNPANNSTIAAANLNAANTLSVNVTFTDPWFSGSTGNESFAYVYTSNAMATGLTTTIPTGTSCATTWVPTCRIVINYETHIHPLWSVTRGTVDTDHPLGSDTCVSCHSSSLTQVVQRDPDGDGIFTDTTVPRPPDGNLELDDDPAQTATTQYRAYLQLTAAHAVLILGPADTLIQQTDTSGNGVTVAGPIRAGGANASTSFFPLFATGGSHAGRLTTAELRLLSEWVDIGASYYNDPFKVPLAQ